MTVLAATAMRRTLPEAGASSAISGFRVSSTRTRRSSAAVSGDLPAATIRSMTLSPNRLWAFGAPAVRSTAPSLTRAAATVVVPMSKARSLSPGPEAAPEGAQRKPVSIRRPSRNSEESGISIRPSTPAGMSRQAFASRGPSRSASYAFPAMTNCPESSRTRQRPQRLLPPQRRSSRMPASASDSLRCRPGDASMSRRLPPEST